MEGNTVNLIIALVCMGLSGFFSSSEAAFLSIQRTRVQHLLSIGKPGAQLVSDMQKRPERLLSTILLGNNLVNVLFASMATILTLSFIGSAESIWFVISTIITISVVLVFGEVIPKALAVQYSDRIVFWYARPLKALETVFYPAVIILEWIGKKVQFTSKGDGPSISITEGEFRTLIDVGEAEGALEPREAELLESVFKFGDRKVGEVMTPRPEIVMLREGTTLKEFLSIHDKHAHSRFPVYKEDGDDIVGTVSVKDIVKTMATGQVPMNKSLESALRPTLFVPESKLVGDLFEEMRREGVQLAIVVNEYGGVAGLATLKQLLEEIVGPVGEEGQTPEEEFEAIDQHTFQVEGGMDIEEANTELNLRLPKGDYDTVAGFALSILGHIPTIAETFVSEGLRFEIAEMRGLKIGQIKITHQLDGASSDGTEKPDGASSGRHGRQDI